MRVSNRSGWFVGFALMLVLIVASCARSEPRVMNDLPYKAGETLTDYERERCKLDLYLPEAKSFPTMVWFHGGGLENGKKEDFVKLGNALAQHGVAVVEVNYRLSPKVKYPAYLEDAAAAVAWTIQHIAERGGDPKQVFVGGHSAGGYLAAGVGYDPKYLAAFNLKLTDLAGLVPVSPQVFTHFTIRKERGIPNAATTPVIDDAAPCYHASKDAPPTLVLVGDKDLPTRLEECQYFVAVLNNLKHPDARMQVIADRDHSTIASKSSEENDPVLTAMLDFVKKHPKK